MMTNSKLAHAVTMAMTGTALSVVTATASGGTTSYNTFNHDRPAPNSLVSGGNGTDGWMRTTAASSTAPAECQVAGSYCGAGPGTSNNPSKQVPTGNVAVPWAGKDPRDDPKFQYKGNQTLNWTAVLESAGDSVTISHNDAFTRYKIHADIDTAKGAWHDNTSTGWAHDTDIGLFRSEVTQVVTLTISSLLASGQTNVTPKYGFTVFEGQTSSTGNYNHHQGWHAVTPAEAQAVGNNEKPISENPPLAGATGLAKLILDDVVGNSATFTAEAGKVYTIYLGGFQAGDWTETRNDYQLVISGAAPPAKPKLTVGKIGTGSGKVTSSPAGIDCGTICNATFDSGKQVTLTAAPDNGSQFSGWSSACTNGSGPCTVTMDKDKNVTAKFDAATPPPSGKFPLTMTKSANGNVTSSPAGIDCGSTGNACSFEFNSGATVTLTATPSSGYQFSSWSGCTSTTSQCTVAIDTAKNVTANFAITAPPGQFALTVTNGGNGKVTSSPTGIDCGSTCSASFDRGTTVTLTAAPDSGFQFTGWGGACSGTDSCSVTMSEARTVTTSFTATGTGPYPLAIEKRGSGSVTSSPAGIDCGGTCSNSFDSGTLITLTATPSTGWRFAGWSGACGGAEVCTVSMDTARNIKATFALPPRRDFDGDGRADLFWRQGKTGRNNQWLMIGNQLKASSSVSTKGKGWSIAAVTDFDGDQRADVLWRRQATGQNQLWLMKGTTAKSVVVLPDQATAFTAVRTGDFDGDGNPDLLWHSPASGEASLWLMDGPSFKSAVALPAALPGYALSEIDDFNGDGTPDVWWNNAASGENSLWLMAGTAVQSTVTPPAQPGGWVLAGAGLFDDDIKADVLWHHRATGANQLWLMDGSSQTSSVELPATGKAWFVASIDDFTGKGRTEILWRNRGNGKNRLWVMEGTELKRKAAVTAFSRGWATPAH